MATTTLTRSREECLARKPLESPTPEAVVLEQRCAEICQVLADLEKPPYKLLDIESYKEQQRKAHTTLSLRGGLTGLVRSACSVIQACVIVTVVLSWGVWLVSLLVLRDWSQLLWNVCSG